MLGQGVAIAINCRLLPLGGLNLALMYSDTNMPRVGTDKTDKSPSPLLS